MIRTRDIKLDIILGKYKCISAYLIPRDHEGWLECPDCGLKPLVWEFNNGSSTACGCGRNEYDHHSIWSESIMSYVTRNGGSALGWDSDGLRKNWNHWVLTGEELCSRDFLIKNGRW